MHALEAFEAAARLGTFAQAAEALFVTQSAISHRIRQLEESLGARLFVRVHKQVVLTPQGETFLAGVREAMQHIATAAAGVRGRPGRKVRITATPSAASAVILPRLAMLLERMPDLDLEIDTSERVNDLADGRFDLAVRMGGGTWPGLASERLSEERVGAYASPAYAGKFGRVRTLRTLERAALVHSRPFPWPQWLRAVGGPVQLAARTTGVHFHEHRAAIDAATHGLGVVLSNRLTSIEARRAGRLVPFVPETVDLRRDYYAAWVPASGRKEVVRAVVAWLRDAFAETLRDD
jgi:LysR family glycine cleavage system transcriptional activator